MEEVRSSLFRRERETLTTPQEKYATAGHQQKIYYIIVELLGNSAAKSDISF